MSLLHDQRDHQSFFPRLSAGKQSINPMSRDSTLSALARTDLEIGFIFAANKRLGEGLTLQFLK
jgi:hypothetical protein